MSKGYSAALVSKWRVSGASWPLDGRPGSAELRWRTRLAGESFRQIGGLALRRNGPLGKQTLCKLSYSRSGGPDSSRGRWLSQRRLSRTVRTRLGWAVGRPARDRVLQSVVRAMRARLRSFDPIIRYGGDEFVCGLGGTEPAEAERRFDLIGLAVEADAGVRISVGLAELEPGDTADGLTERADAAMLGVKAAHRARLQRTLRGQ